MTRLEAQRLLRALTGGLSVDVKPEPESGCSIEAVIAHVAAAQIRAVRFALVMGEPDDTNMEEGRGWCTTGSFTRLDAVAALGGAMALLQDSHSIAEDIRLALSQPAPAEGEVAP